MKIESGEVKVWAMSRFGQQEITVEAPSAFVALSLLELRATEGHELARAVNPPDRIELIVAADICQAYA